MPAAFASATRGSEHVAGFFDVYRDASKGRVLRCVRQLARMSANASRMRRLRVTAPHDAIDEIRERQRHALEARDRHPLLHERRDDLRGALHPARHLHLHPHPAILRASIEERAYDAALHERPAQEWLWLAPLADVAETADGRCLLPGADAWGRVQRYAVPLSIPAESLGTVVLQHVADGAWDPELLEECRRLLVPGGRLWLFGLNPLDPTALSLAGVFLIGVTLVAALLPARRALGMAPLTALRHD